MGRRESDFRSVDYFEPSLGGSASQSVFELYVSEGFAETEVAAIINTVQTANDILACELFTWRCVSDAPGYIRGRGGMIVEAEAALDDVVPPHTMIVIGGSRDQSQSWMRRMRVMLPKMLPVVLLSEAATLYIQQTNPSGNVTTFWRDVVQLEETGHYARLSTRLSEKSNGVITAAGGASTAELMIGLISPFLTTDQIAELGNRMLLSTIRKSDSEQPKGIADNAGLFDNQITQVLRLMENTIDDPLPITELADEVGISTRQLERAFKVTLKSSPAKFYRRLRAKRARVMIEETLLPMVEVAVATGFGCKTTLAKAIKSEYGMTPSRMRARKSVDLLKFENI